MSASYSVGTPAISVGRFLRISLAVVSGLKTGTRTSRQPLRSPALTSAARPNPWKIGSAARIVSSGPRPIHARTCNPSLTKFECESTMPFGVPVVPPE